MRGARRVPGPVLDALRQPLEYPLRTGALSARELRRIRRVARTLADLGGTFPLIGEEHLSVAPGFRAEVVATRGR